MALVRNGKEDAITYALYSGAGTETTDDLVFDDYVKATHIWVTTDQAVVVRIIPYLQGAYRKPMDPVLVAANRSYPILIDIPVKQYKVEVDRTIDTNFGVSVRIVTEEA